MVRTLNTIRDPAMSSARAKSRWILEANPEGLIHPDQATPKELKNPIHLVTTNLLFNQKTGNAQTLEKVEFSLPQASGSAVGLSYVANTTVLTLQSQVDVDFHGATPARLTAIHGTITKNPRVVDLDLPRSAERRAASHSGQRHALSACRQHRRAHSRRGQRSRRIRGLGIGKGPVRPDGTAGGREAGCCAFRHFLGKCPGGEFRAAADARKCRPGRPEFHREQCAEHGA